MAKSLAGNRQLYDNEYNPKSSLEYARILCTRDGTIAITTINIMQGWNSKLRQLRQYVHRKI